MDLARRIYSRDLKIAAMREIDGGRRIGEVARHLELSPKLLERWRGEWRARGALAFPGVGRCGASPALTELQRIAELERKIGQQALEIDFLKGCLQRIDEQRKLQALAGKPLSTSRCKPKGREA